MSNVLVHSEPAYCPNASKVFFQDRHGFSYMCGEDHTYRDATYMWDVPQPSTLVSIQSLLASAPFNIAFVGDSTVQQVYYAVACELERAGALDVGTWSLQHQNYAKREIINQPKGITMSFAFSRFLRSDLPCAPDCVSNKTETCEACSEDGKPRASSLDLQTLEALEMRPDAFFVGVGSWYNYHKGLYDSDAAFLRTLYLLRNEINASGTPTFWYDIPNCGAGCDKARRTEPAYESDGIVAKNSMARRTLGDVVHYLNVSGAVQPRLAADRTWPGGGPTDGMPHYCSPGHSSITQFIVHVLLTLLNKCLVN